MTLHGDEAIVLFEVGLNENFGKRQAHLEIEMLIILSAMRFWTAMRMNLYFFGDTTAVSLPEFEPVVEAVQINLEVFDPSFSLTSAELSQVCDGTQLTVRYDNDD